jgi:hypothetical protein
MEQAFAEGITAFDTARSYGYGESEQILGDFAATKRGQVAIFSKAGIQSLRPNASVRLAKTLARRVFSLAPTLRSRLRPFMGRQNRGGHFEPAKIRASVLDSLRALRVDRIDILFLHDVPGRIADQDDVFEELQRLQEEGKIGGSGVSGSVEQLVHFLGREELLVGWQFAAARSIWPTFPAGFPPPASPHRIRLGHRVFADEHEASKNVAGTNADRLCAPLVAGVCDAVVASMYSLDHIRANARVMKDLQLPATAST